jgi:hypothetical protein
MNRAAAMNRANVVWLSPSATTFSCLCEECLDAAYAAHVSFAEAVQSALLRGRVALEVEFVRVHCPVRHEIVLRRIQRPESLTRRDERQLQLV